MEKRLLLFKSLLVLAVFTLWSHLSVAQFYIDIHDPAFNNYPTYLISFVSYPSEGIGSPGHTFVVWERETENGPITIAKFGFWPGNGPNSKGRGIFYDFQPGQIQPESDESMKKVDQTITFRVDLKQFESSFKKKEEWQKKPPAYTGLNINCIAFIQDVGLSIGVYLPERTITTLMPEPYLNFVAKTLAERKLYLENGSEITSKNDGSYTNGRMYNHASGGRYFVGSKSEVDFGIMVTTTYSIFDRIESIRKEYINGEVFYQEFYSDGTNSSFYRYQNGNLLFGYDPNKTIQSGYIQTPKGDIYLGESINGIVNGKASLWENNGTKYSYANFKNGVLIDFLETNFNGFKYYGSFENGLPSGNAKMVFPNGDEYTGGFFNGNFQGPGTYAFYNGSKIVGYFNVGRCLSGRHTLKDGRFCIIESGPTGLPLEPRWYDLNGNMINKDQVEREIRGADRIDFVKVLRNEMDFNEGKHSISIIDKEGNLINIEGPCIKGGLDFGLEK